MKQFLIRLLDIYPGGEQKALCFCLLAFCWSLATTLSLKISEALFLLHVGAEHLPQIYFLIAGGMMLLSPIFIYSFHHFSAFRIASTILIAQILFYGFVLASLLNGFGTNSGWIWYAMRAFGAYFLALCYIGFWTFTDLFHHIQEAKRHFILFSTSIFVGATITGVIMNSGYFSLIQLLCGIVTLLIFNFIWLKNINNKLVPIVGEEEQEKEGVSPSFSVLQFVRSVTKSRFTLLLLTSNLLYFLSWVITEYNYLSIFDARFDPGTTKFGTETEAPLTQFLGSLVAMVGITNIIFGMFVYNRLAKRFGITPLLLISPILFLTTYTGWTFSNAMFFSIIGFLTVEGTMYVIDDNNYTLLLNGVPTRLKYKIRVMIETLFEPIGMFISAIILSFPAIPHRLIGLILSACLFFIALALSKHYYYAIYQNLAKNAIQFHKSVRYWFSRFSKKELTLNEHKLFAIFRLNQSIAREFALEGLIKICDETILPKLLQLSENLESHDKTQLIQALANSLYSEKEVVFEWLSKLSIEEEDEELLLAIRLYYARFGLLNPEYAYEELSSEDLNLKEAAILSLKSPRADLPPASAAYYRTAAQLALQELLDSENEIHICKGLEIIGLSFNAQDADILLSFFKHSSANIYRIAAKSFAKIANQDSVRYTNWVIDQLAAKNDPAFRMACLIALEKICRSSHVKSLLLATKHFRPSEIRKTESIIESIGLRTVPTLIAITKDQSLPYRPRIVAGRILGRCALPQLRSNLYAIVEKEVERAIYYYLHYQLIQENYPQLNLTHLKEALQASYYSILDFIIQLLGTAGEVEECALLSESLRSTRPLIRSQVLEMLQKTCEHRLFRLILPLVQEVPENHKIDSLIKSGHATVDLNTLLNRLSESPIELDQVISITIQYQLDMPDWKETLKKQLSSKEEIIHHFAYELLET